MVKSMRFEHDERGTEQSYRGYTRNKLTREGPIEASSAVQVRVWLSDHNHNHNHL
jgi:hypothetical protein